MGLLDIFKSKSKKYIVKISKEPNGHSTCYLYNYIYTEKADAEKVSTTLLSFYADEINDGVAVTADGKHTSFAFAVEFTDYYDRAMQFPEAMIAEDKHPNINRILQRLKALGYRCQFILLP